MQKDVSAHGDGRGRQRRPLQLQRRPPDRDVHAGQGADEPAVPRALERRHRRRRQAQRRARLLLRLLAGPRPAPAADRPEPAAARRRHLALHAGLGPRDAEDRGRVRGRPAAVPAGRAGHRPDRRRSPRRTRAAALPIPKNGAVLLARGSQVAKLQAEATPGTPLLTRLILSARLALDRRHRRPRRRPRDRARRQAGLDGRRGLPARRSSARATRAPLSASARDGKIILARRRRAPPRLQRRDDELGARAGDGQARRGDGLRARRGRLDHDGLRRQAAEPAFGPRRRALGRRVAGHPLHAASTRRRPRSRSSRRTATGSPSASSSRSRWSRPRP